MAMVDEEITHVIISRRPASMEHDSFILMALVGGRKNIFSYSEAKIQILNLFYLGAFILTKKYLDDCDKTKKFIDNPSKYFFPYHGVLAARQRRTRWVIRTVRQAGCILHIISSASCFQGARSMVSVQQFLRKTKREPL